MPEDEVTDAVRWAAQAGAEYLIRESAHAGGDAHGMAEVAVVVSSSTLDFVAEVQRALSCGWQTEEAHRLPAGVRGQAMLVDRLLDGSSGEAELYDLARAEGVDLRPPCLPLLVVAGRTRPTDLRAAAAELAGRRPSTVQGALRSSPVAHVVVAVGNAVPADVPEILATADDVARTHEVIVVAGPPAERLDTAAEAYRRAAAHLAFARVERRRPGVLGSERLRVYGMLARLTVEERVDLCLSVLGPVLRLRPAKREELLVAFEVLGEAGGNQKEAAALLGPGVNGHNVKYRILRLQSLTGLRCDVDGDRLLLSLAVRAYRAWVAAALAEDAAEDQPAVRSSSVTSPHTAR